MSYLERLQAKAAMNAPTAPAKGAKAPSDPFEGEPTGRFTGMPSELSDGLRRLAIMPAPRLINPEAWPTAVSGALGLARDGWAEKALTLGWPALDLFGAVPDPAGDPEGDGLAVWLSGRKVLVLDEMCAVSGDANGGRFYFHRPRAAGAVLMWNLGRGR